MKYETDTNLILQKVTKLLLIKNTTLNNNFNRPDRSSDILVYNLERMQIFMLFSFHV
jgi:hypothetical protein